MTHSAPNPLPGHAIRSASAPELALALVDSRKRTLQLLVNFQNALGESLAVPQTSEVNPPLWELGHIAWFQEFWLARNPERLLGSAANPDAPRAPSLLAQADSLFNSSTVAHSTRWQLPLPDSRGVQAYLEAILAQTLDWLSRSASDNEALYFARLALLHEDMHGEAWVQMAQTLGIALAAQTSPAPPVTNAVAQLATSTDSGDIALPACNWPLGSTTPGFVFDNELGAHSVAIPAFSIAAQPVSLAQFLAFVESGGYRDARYWSPAGWQWINSRAAQHPRHLRRSAEAASGWQQQRFGLWHSADMHAPACHISYFQAQAWCQWAGRRLPSEAEWEYAAITCPETFAWGSVWEWTASPFAPYPGFAPHPYRDYSKPWFGTHQVLRGASWATAARIKHPRYRNFFMPGRNDVLAGFRTCAL